MNRKQIDEYDILLDYMGYESQTLNIPESMYEEHFETVSQLARELKVPVAGNECELVLWNDDINNMMHVLVALYEVCELEGETAKSKMMEAHANGKSVVLRSSGEKLFMMAHLLDKRNIKATVQLYKPE